MRHKPQSFTTNKAYVRMLQCEAIKQQHHPARHGQLRYFGLTSSELEDVRQWESLIDRVTTVERDSELQSELLLNAFRYGLSDRLELLRGDIDNAIILGHDIAGKYLVYPFDVVSLDYSGGIFYRDSNSHFTRLESFSKLLAEQSAHSIDFTFLISCNLDSIDQGEVRKTISNLGTELERYGLDGENVIKCILNHQSDEPRLKIYLPYLIMGIGAKYHYNTETLPVAIYTGNMNVRMLAFRFLMKYDSGTFALRPPRERLQQVINQPSLQIVNGKPTPYTYDIPKLRPPPK